MKKIFLVIIFLISVMVIGGVVYLNIFNVMQNGCKRIDTDDLMYKIENHQTFTVYFYQQNCGACIEASEIIESYIKNSGKDIYMIDLNETNYKNYLAFTLNIQESPTIIHFVSGEEKARLISTFTYEQLKECIENRS